VGVDGRRVLYMLETINIFFIRKLEVKHIHTWLFPPQEHGMLILTSNLMQMKSDKLLCKIMWNHWHHRMIMKWWTSWKYHILYRM
jgi:hypothetical protein